MDRTAIGSLQHCNTIRCSTGGDPPVLASHFRLHDPLERAFDPDFPGTGASCFCPYWSGRIAARKNGFTLPDHPLPIALALLIGGILFIGVEAWLRGRTAQKEITWRIAVMVGLGQLIAAVFPGASRSGTTILIALLMGLSRSRATEFSFLVGIPTMLAAGGYKIWKALKAPLNEGVAEDWAMVAWGAAVSGIVSFMAVKWLLGYVQSHSFRSFGVYRIAVGVLLLLIVFG